MDPKQIGPDSPTPDAAPVAPPRTVEVERTYLTLDHLAQLRPASLPQTPVRLERLLPCPEPTWRALYRTIGAPWHWHDRDAWETERLQRHLDRPEVQVFQLTGPSTARPAHDVAAPVGFLELERHADGSTEIVYLGLDRRCFGQGIGGWLLTETVRLAFAEGASRVWLHTCTLDGPAALPNYLARGFRPQRTETYTARLTG